MTWRAANAQDAEELMLQGSRVSERQKREQQKQEGAERMLRAKGRSTQEACDVWLMQISQTLAFL
jgi:hypothetical protein